MLYSNEEIIIGLARKMSVVHCLQRQQQINSQKNKTMNKNLKLCLIGLLFCVSNLTSVYAQADSVTVERYFSSILDKESHLQQFFAAMPKGGDLHNHLTGSIYAETYFKFAAEDGLWVDMADGKLYNPQDSTKGKEMLKLSPDMANLHKTRMALIDIWSVRNFNPGKFALGADEYFFGTFGLFGAAAGSHMVDLMCELRRRAAIENVQYLEIMLTSPRVNSKIINTFCGADFYSTYNSKLQTAILEDAEVSDEGKQTDKVLKEIFTKWEKSQQMSDYVNQYVAYIDSIDVNSVLPKQYEGRAPVCYYQGYASRNSDPLAVFAQLYLSFKGCLQEGSKMVGVNIVSAEDSEVSMSDYMAHMKMFRYLDSATGNKVNTSLHAGELTIGLVEPEDMRSHIHGAVNIAGANRIGHGVDIAFEANSASLLNTMREKQVAVEINLTSNEFILGVKDDAHPFMLYRQFGVPTVISTDDPGILRTNLTQQYTLIAKRYGVGYYDIKQLVRNSIIFSFMPEEEKLSLLQELESKFTTFETEWLKNIE